MLSPVARFLPAPLQAAARAVPAGPRRARTADRTSPVRSRVAIRHPRRQPDRHGCVVAQLDRHAWPTRDPARSPSTAHSTRPRPLPAAGCRHRRAAGERGGKDGQGDTGTEALDLLRELLGAEVIATGSKESPCPSRTSAAATARPRPCTGPAATRKASASSSATADARAVPLSRVW